MPTVDQIINGLKDYPGDREVMCSHSTGILYVRGDDGRPKRILDFMDQHNRHKQTEFVNSNC